MCSTNSSGLIVCCDFTSDAHTVRAVLGTSNVVVVTCLHYQPSRSGQMIQMREGCVTEHGQFVVWINLGDPSSPPKSLIDHQWTDLIFWRAQLQHGAGSSCISSTFSVASFEVLFPRKTNMALTR